MVIVWCWLRRSVEGVWKECGGSVEGVWKECAGEAGEAGRGLVDCHFGRHLPVRRFGTIIGDSQIEIVKHIK